MDSRPSLNPGREMIGVAALLLCAVVGVIRASGTDFPALHSILDTAVFMASGMLAFLLWDLGWRTDERLPRLKAVVFATIAILELLHVITALDFAELPEAWVLVRLGTWSPAAYLLPLGLAASLPLSRRDTSPAIFMIILVGVAAMLMGVFALVPRYTDPGFLGITRPTLVLAP